MHRYLVAVLIAVASVPLAANAVSARGLNVANAASARGLNAHVAAPAPRLGSDANWQMLMYQTNIQELSRNMQSISNIHKSDSDARRNAIRNIRN